MKRRLAIWLTGKVMKMSRERGLVGPSLLTELVKVDLITSSEKKEMLKMVPRSGTVIKVSIKAIYWMLKAHPKVPPNEKEESK